MKNDNFANRLRMAMRIKGLKQIDIANLTHLDKSLISCYLSGKYEAKQENLTLLAKVLGTNEAWLMGYDIPMDAKFIDCDIPTYITLSQDIGKYKKGESISTDEAMKLIEELYVKAKSYDDMVKYMENNRK